jgi:uncharacterized protein (DUF736 family)
MGANHTGSAWSEVARVAEEYVDRGLLDDDVERQVESLLEENETREALEVALDHYRERRDVDDPSVQ